MKKNLQTYFIILCYCLSFNLHSIENSVRTPTFSVGTFNIEWLGSKKRSSKKFRTPRDIESIALLISHDFQMDIGILQEVYAHQSSFHNSQIHSNSFYESLRQSLIQKDYLLFHSSSGFYQNMVLFWNKNKFTLKDGPIELKVKNEFSFPTSENNCYSSRLRKPLAATFATREMTFHLIGIHLKSQYKRDLCSQLILEKQLEELHHYIKSLPKDLPVIIAGDFNISSIEIKRTNLFNNFIIASSQTHLSKDSAPYSFLKSKAKLTPDHILFSDNFKYYWVTNSTLIYKVNNYQSPTSAGRGFKTFVTNISDHAPVKTLFFYKP